jgi:WD40 repeat protein
MTIASVPSLVEALRQYRLLTPAQMAELTRNLQPRFADPRALAGELLRRNWLTPQQINWLFQTHGAVRPAVAVAAAPAVPAASRAQLRYAAARRRSRTITRVAMILFLILGGGLAGVVYWQWPRSPKVAKHTAADTAEDPADIERRQNLERLAENAMKGIRERAADPTSDPDQLRQQLLSFREQYGGASQTAEAGSLLATLPSPLDNLSANQIDPEETFAGMPPNLVAILGHSQWRNWGAARLVGFSPDGKLVVSAGDDNLVRVRDRRTGKQRFALSAGEVLAMTFINRGQSLEVAATDGGLSRWDLAEGKQRKSIRGPVAQPIRAALSEDGKTVVSLGADGVVKVWSGDDGKERATLKADKGTVTCVAVTPDGRLAATGDPKSGAHVWEADSGEERAALTPPEDTAAAPTRCVAFNTNGSRLVASGDDQDVKVWEIASGKVLSKFEGHEKPVSSVAFSLDGRFVASTSDDQTVRYWEISKDSKMVARFDGHLAPTLAVAVTEDGTTLASASADGSVRLWDLGEKKEETVLDGHSAALQAVAFSDSGLKLASAGLDRKIKVWDVAAGSKLSDFAGHQNIVRALAFTGGGKTLGSAAWDGTVQLWDMTGSKEPAALTGDAGFLNTLAFSGDGRVAVACGGTNRNGLLEVWNTRDRKQTANIEGVPDAIAALALSGDGRTIIAGGLEGNLRIWSGPPWKDRGSIPTEGPIASLALSPDARTVATIDGNSGTIRTWDLAGRKRIRAFPEPVGAPTALVYTPNGKQLISAHFSGQIIVWDAVSGEKKSEWKLPGAVNGLAVAPDGRHLATANGNSTVFILRLAEWKRK